MLHTPLIEFTLHVWGENCNLIDCGWSKPLVIMTLHLWKFLRILCNHLGFALDDYIISVEVSKMV